MDGAMLDDLTATNSVEDIQSLIVPGVPWVGVDTSETIGPQQVSAAILLLPFSTTHSPPNFSWALDARKQ